MVSNRNKHRLAAALTPNRNSGGMWANSSITASNVSPKKPSILNKNMDVWYDGELKFTIKGTVNREQVREMIDWCFKNTKERFVMYGFNELHFEDDADIVAFKLHFGGA